MHHQWVAVGTEFFKIELLTSKNKNLVGTYRASNGTSTLEITDVKLWNQHLPIEYLRATLVVVSFSNTKYF